MYLEELNRISPKIDDARALLLQNISINRPLVDDKRLNLINKLLGGCHPEGAEHGSGGLLTKSVTSSTSDRD